MPFWKDLAERWREKIKTLSLSDEIEPEPDDFTDPADEREAFSEESGEEDHLVKTFACGEEMEEELWTILLPVMEAADGAEMDFLAGKRGKYFRPVK